MSACTYSMMWPMWNGPFAYGSAVVTKSLRGIEWRDGGCAIIANCFKIPRSHSRLAPDSHACPSPRKTSSHALSELIDPVTGRNFVESKSVKNVKVEGDRVSLDIVLGYPARGVLEKVRAQVSERLRAAARRRRTRA